MGLFTAKPNASQHKGKTAFRGDLGMKIIRGKRPGLWQRLMDWAKTAGTK